MLNGGWSASGIARHRGHRTLGDLLVALLLKLKAGALECASIAGVSEIEKAIKKRPRRAKLGWISLVVMEKRHMVARGGRAPEPPTNEDSWSPSQKDKAQSP